MKTLLSQIINAGPSLGRLASEKFKCKGAGKITYAIAKNLSTTEPYVRAYQIARSALMEEYYVQKMDAEGKLVMEDGNIVWVIKDSQSLKMFNDEIDVLLAEEIELDIRMVVLPQPDEGAPSLISGADLYFLEWMVSIEGCE